jgi:hypothetical protein
MHRLLIINGTHFAIKTWTLIPMSSSHSLQSLSLQPKQLLCIPGPSGEQATYHHLAMIQFKRLRCPKQKQKWVRRGLRCLVLSDLVINIMAKMEGEGVVEREAGLLIDVLD